MAATHSLSLLLSQPFSLAVPISFTLSLSLSFPTTFPFVLQRHFPFSCVDSASLAIQLDLTGAHRFTLLLVETIQFDFSYGHPVATPTRCRCEISLVIVFHGPGRIVALETSGEIVT
jgi:hypothetical protein